MTTTPLPPLPEPEGTWWSCNTHGQDGLLDTGDYTADQMQAYATQARADLEAENARLREALEAILDEQNDNEGYAKPATYDAAYAALEFVARHKSSDWPERCQQMVDMARAALKDTK